MVVRWLVPGGCGKAAHQLGGGRAGLAAGKEGQLGKPGEELDGGLAGELAGKFGAKNLSKGVKVEVADDIAMVELAINMKYGYSIPKTCKQVQEKVMQAINSMTGLTVKQVNVRIAGVSLEQD